MVWSQQRLAEEAITRTTAARRPWLDVQMPKFKRTEERVQRIVHGFISQDRIPDQPLPSAAMQKEAVSGAGSDTNEAVVETAARQHELSGLDDQAVALLAGRLVTAEGFGCQSCHQIGNSTPLNVALNAQGSDLTMLGGRIRANWFQRWVRNPARIVPRMEMPAIQVAAPGLLHDSLDTQLEALWRVLNAPDFQPPKANAGEIYVGNLKDSDWGGGHNTGSIVRLKPNGTYPLGIAEMRATASGFEVDFTQPIDASKGSDPQNYLLPAYQRISTPAHGGDDQEQRTDLVQQVVLAEDRRSVVLRLQELREGFAYELNVAPVGGTAEAIFPSQAHYRLRHIPQ